MILKILSHYFAEKRNDFVELLLVGNMDRKEAAIPKKESAIQSDH
jgi:hypothetical protein